MYKIRSKSKKTTTPFFLSFCLCTLHLELWAVSLLLHTLFFPSFNQVHLGFICPKNLSQSCGGSFRCRTLSVTTDLHLVVNHLYSIYIHEEIAWYTYHMKDVDCIGVVWPSFLFGRHGVASTPSHCVLSTLPCVCVQSWKWGKQPQTPARNRFGTSDNR